jgi:glutamate racemase
MNTNFSIGVFDSGVGGLTVVRELISQLPHENIIYFGDTARVPYGTKSPDVVRSYAADDARVLLANNLKLMVIACNTVSAVGLDVVERLAIGMDTLGVIKSGAWLAVQRSKTKRIGVIGTEATIASMAYTAEIKKLDPRAEVFSKACPLFVPLAEEGFITHQATRLIAAEYLSEIVKHDIDTLVLGCTHYPILREVISDAVGESVRIVDSAEAVALDVKKILTDKNLLREPLAGERRFLVSDLPSKFKKVAELFLGLQLGQIEIVKF